MRNDIHIIEQGKSLDELPTEVTSYTEDGADVSGEAKDAVAKSVYDPNFGTTRFYIKRAMFGAEAGKFYDPTSPMFNRATVNAVREDMGRAMYEWSKVTAESFENYLRFLKTRNPSYIRNAERLAI